MTNIKINDAKYQVDVVSGVNVSIKATIDGVVLHVPLDPNNRHYAAILKAVEEGTLVIQEATA